MQSVQKLGGIGALISAGTFVVGLTMLATVFTGFVATSDPADAVEFIAENQPAMHLWNLTITILFGIALVPLVLAVGDRLRDAHSPLARLASVFGLIWSGVVIATGMISNLAYAAVGDLHGTDAEMAATVWAALDLVTNGLGGGNEVLGGLWVLGISTVALRERLFARWVNHLGVVMGIAALFTVVPALEAVGAVFGLGLIVWFTAVGVHLLADDARSARQRQAPPQAVTPATTTKPTTQPPNQATTQAMERQS